MTALNLQQELLRWSADPDRADGRCVVIGEVAQAHDGSLGMAHAYIDAIAKAGADAVKFQTHIASAESTPQEQWRVKFSYQDQSRYDYWQRMEFTEEQWHALKKHAAEVGLLFLSSPFSPQAVDLLSRVGVAGWKVASGEISSAEMFQRMAISKLPFLISTGMSGWKEIDAVVAKIKERKLPFALMQCTTAYPCPPEKVGLNLITEFRSRYQCPAGLSDHSGTIYPGLAAAALSCAVLEVHVTMSREMFGPDVKASVTTAELKQLVEGVRFIEKMRASSVEKDAVAAEMAPLRNLFTKSIVALHELPAGHVLKTEDLALKKPGTGIPEERLPALLNRRLKRAVTADAQILEEYLE